MTACSRAENNPCQSWCPKFNWTSGFPKPNWTTNRMSRHFFVVVQSIKLADKNSRKAKTESPLFAPAINKVINIYSWDIFSPTMLHTPRPWTTFPTVDKPTPAHKHPPPPPSPPTISSFITKPRNRHKQDRLVKPPQFSFEWLMLSLMETLTHGY